MVQSLPIKISENTNLHDLKQHFGLQLTETPDFFAEWRDPLPPISDTDAHALDHVKQNYYNLTERSQISENLVKMAILSPLLDLAGFYSADFRLKDEAAVRISVQDEGIIYKGKIDVLVLQDQFWILVIESKNSGFSLNKATPQALAYMLSSPNHNKPTFGLVANGSDFRFLKLTHQTPPLYAPSEMLSVLNPGNDLYRVLQILKRISTLIL